MQIQYDHVTYMLLYDPPMNVLRSDDSKFIFEINS